MLPVYDPALAHADQVKAAETLFRGRRVRVRAGALVDGGSAFAPERRTLKRRQVVRVSAVSFGQDGLFLRFGHGERAWWVSADDVELLEPVGSGRRLRLSGLALPTLAEGR